MTPAGEEAKRRPPSNPPQIKGFLWFSPPAHVVNVPYPRGIPHDVILVTNPSARGRTSLRRDLDASPVPDRSGRANPPGRITIADRQLVLAR